MLAFVTGDRENEQALTDLPETTALWVLQQVGLWITNGNPAMHNALAAKLATTPRQRCVKHKLENVLSYISKAQHDTVEPELKAIFYQPSREKADQAWIAFCEKYEKIYPTAIECLKRDGEACLAFYAFLPTHWKTIRTTNIGVLHKLASPLGLRAIDRRRKHAVLIRNLCLTPPGVTSYPVKLKVQCNQPQSKMRDRKQAGRTLLVVLIVSVAAFFKRLIFLNIATKL